MALLHVGTAAFPPGGGAFELPHLTLGILLQDQPTHRYALGGDRRRHVPLERGQGWILPSGGQGVCEYDAALDLTTVEFNDRLLQEVGLDLPAEAPHRFGALDPLALQLAVAAPAFGAGGRLYRETMERAFAAHIAQTLRPQRAEAARVDDTRLGRAIDYIHDHLAEDLSLEDMAATAAMSAFHFARVFRKATGTSPLQYVIGARIDRAKVLLRTTRHAVAEVAFRVGYSDVSRFSRHFRRSVGATPADFRAA